MEKRFAFLIHSRNSEDVQRKYKIAKYLPKFIIKIWCLFASPVIVSKITGLRDQDTGEEIEGLIVGVPMTAKQLLDHRKKAQKRIIQAIKKVEKMGIKVVGLGALTSSVTNGGKEIKDKVESRITTGHGYTIITVTETFFAIAKRFNLDIGKIKVAIVGAAGSIGSGVAEVLAKKGIKNLLLIETKKREEALREFTSDLKEKHDIFVEFSCDIKDIKDSDIVITATNASETLVKDEHVKSGMIFINDAQPSDISPEVIEKREDILVLEGGLINTNGVSSNFNFSLDSKEDNFSCLGEVMILAANKWFDKNNIGKTNMKIIEDLACAGEELGFGISRFQNFHKVYSKNDLDKFVNNLV